jgi:DNA-binding transcriptional LysR family regulator
VQKLKLHDAAVDWDDARVFLAVARMGQILAASKRLKINHATLSRRISGLEKALETRLFVRRTTGCQLTLQGEAFYEVAERIETEMLAVQARIGRVDLAIAGTVRIGAPDGFGVSFLATRLGRLMSVHPELKIELVPVLRHFSLPQREADLAVTSARPVEGRLVSVKLTDYTLGLYASQAYLDEYGMPRSPRDLKSHRRIGYLEDLLFGGGLVFDEEVMPSWETSFQISSAIGQVAAVGSGAGIGLLSHYVARERPGLVKILPEVSMKGSYWITWHESVGDLTRVRTVIEFLRAAVAREHHLFVP